MTMAKKVNYRWKFRSDSDVNNEIPSFFQRHNIPAGTAKILFRRGIKTEDALGHFLYDTLDDLADPFLMKGMEAAVERILSAIEKKEKIVIYGDYDVDGITATSIMIRGLKKLGANVDFYIPLREEEGYGLNEKAIHYLVDQGFALLITVDCGIASADLVAKVSHLIDIIITDHHQIPPNIPQCVSVLDTHRDDCMYPYKDMAGCGVAYTVCRALFLRKYGERYEDTLELVALGTIADVVSLTGENRILVREGMARFLCTPIKGLSALLSITGLVNENTKTFHSAEQVSFGLAPRLNAAGRIAHAKYGVELMLTDDGETAEKLARKLYETNNERRVIEKDIYEEAIKRIEELHTEDDMVLVIDGKDWHPGVIGIVASRVLELYHKPALILTIRDGVGKGSCRSIPAFNIYKALSHCSDLLIQFGGHTMAAGFSIKEENIPAFRQKINQYAKSILKPEDFLPILEIEDRLALSEFTVPFVESLDLLEPFGCDNPKPLFAARNLYVENARYIGQDNKHIKYQLGQQNSSIDALLWNVCQENVCHVGDVVDMVFEPEINNWYGKRVQLIGKDLHIQREPFLTRELLVSMFLQLKKDPMLLEGKAVYKVENDIYRNLKSKMTKNQIEIALSVFEELKILKRCHQSGTDYYQMPAKFGEKMDLTSSCIYEQYKK